MATKATLTKSRQNSSKNKGGPAKSKGLKAKSSASKTVSKASKPQKTRVAAGRNHANSRGGNATKVESPSASASLRVTADSPRVPAKQYADAVAAYEAAIKLMYAEDYEKAIKAFNKLIAEYPDEPEIHANAKARIQACDKKITERSRTVVRSAEDHYNLGIAFLNEGRLDLALNHLQHALKLAPKGDHILYAMAAANALQGNKDQALLYLRQSIHHRPENRFLAAQDSDFAVLGEEPGFKDLLVSEK